MDAIDLLEHQHRELEAFFREFRLLSSSEPKSRLAIFELIADAVEAHAQMEERLFYPAARFHGTDALLLQGAEDNRRVQRLLAELAARQPGEPAFDERFVLLEQAVLAHAHAQEHGLFPLVKTQLGTQRLEALGEAMMLAAAELGLVDEEPERPDLIDYVPDAPPY
ncbi:MAG: hemerythrin domain-containing protein [Deltaproteobacteria bacterium]|nr:hemerythrin domain-containing protein [Deltaproteobacteria bacterium]